MDNKMKILKTASYKQSKYNPADPDFDYDNMKEEELVTESDPLKRQGYRMIKHPLFGGEEWKNDVSGKLLYKVPEGLLSLQQYIEQYVKEFVPRTSEDKRTKRAWLNYVEEKPIEEQMAEDQGHIDAERSNEQYFENRGVDPYHDNPGDF